VNGTLFFTADDGTTGDELWRSDGTAAGTVLVKDIAPGASESHPGFLTNVNGTLFFTAEDGTHGRELWKSDGTPAGTVLVRDINPGSASSSPSNLTAVNGMLFFTAIDDMGIWKLWQSDGTAAGTVVITDLEASSLTNVNGTLFFAAIDGIHGQELWTLVNDAPPPTVGSTVIANGSAQRSRDADLSVTFSTQVTFAGPVASAFTLTRNGGGAVNFTATASVVGGVTVVMLNGFTGSATEFGSLIDGRYTLTALASQISANGQQLDGNGDGLGGDDFTFGDAQGLFRLFGDINGDQVVNGLDFGFFKNAFGTQVGDPNYLSYFDFNGDGVINGFDLGQFRTRFGTMLP
jgi:ELWxxDGT repeat protein